MTIYCDGILLRCCFHHHSIQRILTIIIQYRICHNICQSCRRFTSNEALSWHFSYFRLLCCASFPRSIVGFLITILSRYSDDICGVIRGDSYRLIRRSFHYGQVFTIECICAVSIRRSWTGHGECVSSRREVLCVVDDSSRACSLCTRFSPCIAPCYYRHLV